MMGAKADVCVVIPTLNESETIGDIIAGLREIDEIKVRAMIVDDGSTDGTREIVEEESWRNGDVHLIKRGRKQGLGTAIREGITRSLELDPPPEFIVTMDGDLSHDPKEIPGMVRRCGRSSVVVGSRYVEGGEIRGWHASRHVISRGANIVARRLGRIPARDCTSGFRCYGADLEKAIAPRLEASGFDIQIEMLALAARRGFRILEVPITFRDRENGNSKLDASQILRYLWTAFRLFLNHR